MTEDLNSQRSYTMLKMGFLLLRKLIYDQVALHFLEKTCTTGFLTCYVEKFDTEKTLEYKSALNYVYEYRYLIRPTWTRYSKVESVGNVNRTVHPEQHTKQQQIRELMPSKMTYTAVLGVSWVDDKTTVVLDIADITDSGELSPLKCNFQF